MTINTKLFLILPLIGMLSCGKAKNEDVLQNQFLLDYLKVLRQFF